MGQARRKKLAKLSETDRGRKLWDASVIKKFLPEGHRPIATRYSHTDGCLHVACEDGSLHKISWQDAERAERKLYIPTSTERGGKAGQGQRTECPPTGSDGEAGEAGETESD